MKFTKLRIAGFKTFVEPTDMVIEDGLTGVVGPNGCGKSNLVEAMRWVMGESSYKAMRAGGMEEVIFSGSGKRPARNSAEVKLFLDNQARRAPTAFNEHEQLEVSRRIEREKGSNYKVNGREARARDVQLMFADAASGARSPSMVRQGQIGEIISAKPVKRRALLEEAAGISGLHTRRHEAELRLRAAETNIERLDDVIGELDRQLDALRRQARQAARFREVAEKTRTAEAGVFALKWAAANSAANEAAQTLRDAADLLARADEGQLSAATAQASAAASVPDAREKAAMAEAALARIVRARDELALEEKQIVERLDSARAQLTTLDADIAREAGLSSDHQAEKTALDEELKVIALAEETSQTQEPALQNAASNAETALAQALKASNEARDALAKARADIAASARILETAKAETVRISRAHENAQAHLEKLQAETCASLRLDETRQRVEALKNAREEAGNKVAASETARTEALAAVADAEAPLRAREKELAALEAEVAALEKLVSETGYLAGDLAGGADGATYPSVMDAIKVESGYEAALGAALGEALEAASDAAAPQFWTQVKGAGDPQLPAGVEPLINYVSPPKVMDRALAQIGLVEDEQGAQVQATLAPGQLLVSVEGTVWRWDGYVRKADAPSAAAIKLAERNRLEDLRKDADTAKADVSTLAMRHMAVLTAMNDADTAWNTHRGEQTEARRAYDEAASGLMALEREAEREGARLESARAETQRLAEAKTQAEQAVAEAESQSVDDGGLRAMETALSEAQTREADARMIRDKAIGARDQLARELADHARRREATLRAIEAWQRRADAANKHAQTLAKRRADLQDTLTKLDGEPGRLLEKRRSLASTLAGAEEERGKCADFLARVETAQRDADTKAREIKDAYFAAREAHGRAEERKSAADERRRSLEAMILEAVDAAPHQLMAMAGFETGKQPPALETLERDLAGLKEARQRLGAVNLQAEQEAEEVAERRDTLTMERDDVAEAITKLRGTINTLNREGRTKLLDAFDRVNEQFTDLFTRLFGGGEAHLTLIDADDPLDAGLEIIAKPPGKKPQSITLLSGGEQALTAMALIFAVFLTNPAPICILDEVDAPLDDANVERFCELLDDMSNRTSTRFLVVTHNPITMSRMDRLYGVTMAERGVSQIVSVALAQAEALIESETAA
jgi:chromosome segregation protein